MVAVAFAITTLAVAVEIMISTGANGRTIAPVMTGLAPAAICAPWTGVAVAVADNVGLLAP